MQSKISPINIRKLPKPKFRFKSATEEDSFDDEQPSAGSKLALLPMSKMSPVIARVGGIVALSKRLVGRRPSYIVVAAALLVLLVLVPFEVLVGDRELVIRIHIALGSAAFGLVIWRFLVAKEKSRSGELVSESVDEISEQQESVTSEISTAARIEENREEQQKAVEEYVTLKYSCGHSGKISKALVEGWMKQKSIPTFDLSIGIIEITVICQHCQDSLKQHVQAPAAAQIEKTAPAVVPAGKPKKKKKMMMVAAGAAAIIMVVGVFGSGSGPVSGLLDPIKERVCGMVGLLTNPGGMLPGTPSIPDFSESLPSEIPEGLPPGMTQLPDTSGGLPGMSGLTEDVPGISILNSFCGTS